MCSLRSFVAKILSSLKSGDSVVKISRKVCGTSKDAEDVNGWSFSPFPFCVFCVVGGEFSLKNIFCIPTKTW